MKKRKIWLIIAIIGLVVMGCTSPNDNDTKNTTVNLCANGHDFPEWISPICEVAGNSERECSRCEATDKRTEGFAALEHDMQLFEGAEVILAPTCTQNGIGETACMHGCGKTEEDGVLLAIGHHHVATGVVHAAATCTTAGSEEKKCDNLDGECGDIIAGDEIPALTHRWIDNWIITKDPTCTANGDRYRICDQLVDCEERETEPNTINVHALGHDWKYDDGANVQTCTVPGSGARHCLRDDCSEKSTGGTYPALGHLWIDNWVITKQPTCTANGDRYRICDQLADCEERETETNTINLKALDHEWLTESWVITKHLTCLKNGDRERECNRAGCSVKQFEDDTENLLAYGLHHYTTTPPTCTTASVPHNCGRQLQNGTGNYICGGTNLETPVPALGHLAWVWTTYNSSNGHISCTRDNCSGGFAAIGDTGPAGGIIFYVADGKDSRPLGITIQGYGDPGNTGYFAQYTAYYLEAAPENESGTSQWGTRGTLINGISTWLLVIAKNEGLAASIGVGRKDTQTIVNSAAFAALTDTAAQRCASKNFGGKTDWFLPSLGELNEFYKLKGQAGVPQTGIPTTGRVWSSSQGDSAYAWGQDFANDSQNNILKTNNLVDVRAIRAF